METWETGARGLRECVHAEANTQSRGWQTLSPGAKYGPSPVSNTSMVKIKNLEHF